MTTHKLLLKFSHECSRQSRKEGKSMGVPIEYQKLLTEIVYINMPGPEEPNPGMTGGELLHGFLAELYRAPNPDVKNYVSLLCGKWNVVYRGQKG
jgi:hypothetical protein